MSHLREQLRDPLLTLLTLLLVFWMFVLAPLHAAAVIDTDIIGFILALAVTGALLILSPKPGAVIAMLIAIGPRRRRGVAPAATTI